MNNCFFSCRFAGCHNPVVITLTALTNVTSYCKMHAEQIGYGDFLQPTFEEQIEQKIDDLIQRIERLEENG